MTSLADVKWIKLTTNMFDNRKIKHLRRLPEGNSIVLIWVMLLTMAGRCNANGMIFLTENIPYTPKMLADELDFEENTVKLALEALEQFNMIVTDGKYFAIAGWEEYQNIEGMEKIREQNRKRVADYRARKKQELIGNRNTCEYCGKEGTTVDHIIPKIKGGLDVPENTVCSCLSCNMMKTNRDVDVFLNELLLTSVEFELDRILSNEKIMKYVTFDDEVSRFKSRYVTLQVMQRNGVDIEEDKEIESDNKKKKEKEIRHKYGEYNNVLLSDSEYEKLKAEFPSDYTARIENLSSYIASTGKTYKSHFATIRNWARKDKGAIPKAKPRYGNFDVNEAFNRAVRRTEAEMHQSDKNAKTAGNDAFIRERAEALKQQLS